MKTYSAVFTIIMIIIGFTSCNQSKKFEPETMSILVGTYTGGASEGIYRLSFNPEDGSIEYRGLVAKTENPSYLAISKDRQFLFTANEKDSGGISSFSWDENNQEYNLVSEQYSEGAHPCYISLNDSETLLAVANYSSGNVAVFAINEDGKISGDPAVFQHQGKGPVAERQEGPHAHYSQFTTHGDYIYAVDLGIDEIISYPVNAGGSVGDGKTAIKVEPGDGPRHMVFHPSGDYAFVVNELSNSVLSMEVDEEKGTLKAIDRVSTLPDDFKEHSQCADIHITSDGRFLYASNRGHNSIAIFEVSDDGKLTFLGYEPTRGDWPRNFTLSPDDNFLLVANQNSNNVVVFKRDKETGLLTFTGHELEVPNPVCLKF